LNAPLSREEKESLLALLEEKQRRLSLTRWLTYYPAEGPLRRELYPKHLQFFQAGQKHRQRLMLAANRVGKTEGVGLYELTLHLTGDYPDWWHGRRFDRPVKCWAAGDTHKTVREILQAKLIGPVGAWGTGVLPGASIERMARAAGVADSIDSVYVRHSTGGTSVVTFKSYDQRRESFQGTEQDVILLDEEPPMDIYTECLLRTMTNNGMLMLTFTPLTGMSEVVLAFLPGGKLADHAEGSKFVVMATWDDVPHLSEDVKKELWESIPPFQRDARSKGVPQLGAGAIYPVPESDIVVPDFEVPAHWPRVYGMDVGWNRTAAVWGAVDRESGTVYLYSEHYRGQAEPVIQADAIRGRGEWIPGAIDPASRGRGQRDGEQLLQDYIDLGLNLVTAVNARESGLYAVWQRLSSGKLKVFKSLGNWLGEFRLYRRDEKGAVVKENDHLMDATRYLIVSGLELAKTKPAERQRERPESFSANGWMG
jgi:phage terminase large subunit-like protein